MTQRDEDFDQRPERPARLPAVADDGENLPTRRGHLLQAAIDHRGVVQGGDDALQQFIEGPLIARLAQLVRDLAQERFFIALQRFARVLIPALGAQWRASKNSLPRTLVPTLRVGTHCIATLPRRGLGALVAYGVSARAKC